MLLGGRSQEVTPMIDDTPDYTQYSLDALYDVEQHINKEEFPTRYARVLREIRKRELIRGERPSWQSSAGGDQRAGVVTATKSLIILASAAAGFLMTWVFLSVVLPHWLPGYLTYLRTPELVVYSVIGGAIGATW